MTTWPVVDLDTGMRETLRALYREWVISDLGLCNVPHTPEDVAAIEALTELLVQENESSQKAVEGQVEGCIE